MCFLYEKRLASSKTTSEKHYINNRVKNKWKWSDAKPLLYPYNAFYRQQFHMVILVPSVNIGALCFVLMLYLLTTPPQWIYNLIMQLGLQSSVSHHHLSFLSFSAANLLVIGKQRKIPIRVNRLKILYFQTWNSETSYLSNSIRA